MRQTVLVIDDSEHTHQLVRARLKAEPVDILSAASGTEGIEMAAAKRPDLILLDVDMPEPDGFEVCRRLKLDPATCETPIVFLTGASAADQKLKGLELGAVDYITKPFDPAELRARVRASLRTRQLLNLLSDKAAVLQANEERFRFLAENSSDVISRHDMSGAFLYVSPACRAVLGYAPDELAGRAIGEITHPDDAAAVGACFAAGDVPPGPASPAAEPAASRQTHAVTFRARCNGGGFVWLEASSRIVRDPATGAPLEVHMTSRDVTSRKLADELERGRVRVFQMIAEGQPLPEILLQLVRVVEEQYPAAHASAVLLMDGRLEHAAPSLPPAFRAALDARLLGFASEVCRDPAYERSAVVCTDIATNPYWANVREAALAAGVRTCWSILMRSAAENVVGIFAIYHTVPVEAGAAAGTLLDAVGKLITIASENRELTSQLAHRAHHDSLTGLPNRLLFEDRLAQGMARAGRGGKMLALLCIDLDRFKYINDTLGHHAGDMLLTEFSRRVQSTLRQTDTLARLGGDEFSLVVPDLSERHDALLMAQRVLNVLKPPFDLAGEQLCVTGSVGVAVYPHDGTEPATLQKHADVALYRAKALGRNGFQCFTQDMLTELTAQLHLETLLRRASGDRQFELHYQPQVDRDGLLVGFEALLRWRHPDLGLVHPARFIPLAEETGLIVPIGEWVLNETCRQAKAWQRAGYPPVRVAANVSTLQFSQPGFADAVGQALARHDLDPRWLELEITESLLMKNPTETAHKLGRIRAGGVKVAVDDFGTGYSSLAYLQQLPIDALKIDRSFVQQVRPVEFGSSSPANDTAVIRAILSLGHSLGMSVVAEGVEHEHQAEFLREHGCNVMQGHYFGRPQPAAEAAALLDAARPLQTPPRLPLSA